MILVQRRRKLESMEKEDDLDTVMAKLNEQAAKHNIDRFHSVMEIKVRFWSNFRYDILMVTRFKSKLSHTLMFGTEIRISGFGYFILLTFLSIFQCLLAEAVSLKQSFAEKHMRVIEFDAKVISMMVQNMLF